MRRVRVIVYAVAFGTGLMLGAMLFRPAAQVHPPGQNAGGAARRTVAILQRASASPNVSPVAAKPAEAGTVSRAQPAGPQAVPSPPQSQHLTAPSPPASRSSAFRAAPPAPVPARPQAAPHGSGSAAAPEGAAVGHDADGPSSIVVTPPPDDAALPRAQQPAEEGPRFHVQVGNFSTAEGAQALVKRLQSLGYVATAPDGDGHRVWVGGYFDRETAERLAATLRKAGFNASIVP